VTDELLREQMAVVARYGVKPLLPNPDEKLGIAEIVRSQQWPLNGLRHPKTSNTCGWYIWSGEELSSAPDFFVPLHVSHLEEWAPAVVPYLALPPGWRFLIAPDYEDVWFDESLLDPRE